MLYVTQERYLGCGDVPLCDLFLRRNVLRLYLFNLAVERTGHA